MAATVKLDVTRRAQCRNTINGIVIVRQAMVYGLSIAAGTSDPEVIVQCLGVAGFPGLLTSYPVSGYENARLEEQNVRGIQTHTSTVDVDLVYRGPPLSAPIGGGIFFTLTQASVQDVRQWYTTADKSKNLRIWYKAGDNNTAPDPPIFGKYDRNTYVHRIRSHEVLRASAVASSAQWAAVRDSIRAAKDTLNNATWGGYGRGRWLFLGALTRTLDSAGSQLYVELPFVEDPDGHFPVAVWRDAFGNIPNDIATEQDVGATPPAVGNYINRNGRGRYSIYLESDFGSLFGFTPTT